MAKLLDDLGPDPIDQHVGLRLRMRRKEIGMSQERLAEAVGLTFQQIQKYERAANRISASKLWEVAQALGTTVGYFYEGIGGRAEARSASSDEAARDFLMTPEGHELADSFPRIRQPQVRRKLIELVRMMTEAPPHDS